MIATSFNKICTAIKSSSNTPHNLTKHLTVIAACSLLAACDPEFRSSSSQCSVSSGGSSILPLEGDASTPLAELFLTPAQTTETSYKLYLEDLLEASEAADGETLTEEQQESIATFISFINDADRFNLGYVIDNGQVVSSANVIDFLESISDSTDPDVQNGLFQQARGLVGQAAENDDDTCRVSGLSTTFALEGSPVEEFDTISEFSYNPFNAIDDDGPQIPSRIDHIYVVSQTVEDPDDPSLLLSVPFIGSKFMQPSDYLVEGFAPPLFRQLRLNTAERSFNLLLDDDFENRLTTLELAGLDTFCMGPETEDTDGDGEVDQVVVQCPAGTETRTPLKAQCADTSGDEDAINETGQVQINDIDLNSSQIDFKRIRLEADHLTNEIRVYASNYITAILDSDGTTLLEDPTNCETQAVLDERIEMTPDEIIILSNVPDPAYDFFDLTDDDGNFLLDDDGNRIPNEPTPIFTFTGTVIPGR